MPTTSASSSAALSLKDLCKGFDSGGERIEVLQGLSLQVRAGECVAVTGPSGSGKTTLLHVAAGLERPDAGEVRAAGTDPYDATESERAAFRRRSIGLVFQQHHLLPQLTALENVLLPVLADHPAASEDDLERARQLLREVGLSERAGHRPAQLSGGERQRVAVARALINRPAVVLADEPTAALDRTTARAMAELLARLTHDTGVAMLVATHDLDLAATLDRALPLCDGKLGGGGYIVRPATAAPMIGASSTAIRS